MLSSPVEAGSSGMSSPGQLSHAAVPLGAGHSGRGQLRPFLRLLPPKTRVLSQASPWGPPQCHRSSLELCPEKLHLSQDRACLPSVILNRVTAPPRPLSKACDKCKMCSFITSTAALILLFRTFKSGWILFCFVSLACCRAKNGRIQAHMSCGSQPGL